MKTQETIIEKAEKIFQRVEEVEKTDFVTARFGNHWKEHAKENYDLEVVINIAHKNGRKVELLERAIVEMLSETSIESELKMLNRAKTDYMKVLEKHLRNYNTWEVIQVNRDYKFSERINHHSERCGLEKHIIY